MAASRWRFDSSEVQRFYDRQTAGFVALGQGGSEGAIHRAVWGPGVTTRTGAFHFVEDRLAALLDASPERRGDAGAPFADGTERRGFSPGGPTLPHVVDLGCGVGGSLIYLARQRPMRGTGITLSPVQAELARARIAAAGLSDRLSCQVGDFTRLPPAVREADLAFAIEAFVHASSPAAFFAECARLILPGGHLVLCDDLLVSAPTPRARRIVDRFRRGWQVNALLTRDELIDAASAVGFVHEESLDLTPWLELGRPRDKAIAAFVALFGWLPLAKTPIAHVVGGSALQTGLRRGWLQYALVRFRRAAR